MTAMLIASILLVASFTGTAIWMKRGIPESISSLVYIFRWRWLWTLWLWAVTFLLAPGLIETMGGLSAFGFLTLASLLFVGVFPLFDTEHRKIHYLMAVFAGVMSQVCVLFICPWWLLSWLLMVGLVLYDSTVDEGRKMWYHGKATFFAEVICYVSMVGSLM